MTAGHCFHSGHELKIIGFHYAIDYAMLLRHRLLTLAPYSCDSHCTLRRELIIFIDIRLPDAIS